MDLQFDVVIAGAGSAGCVLAARLSENADRRVCLIEAGGTAVPDDVRNPLRWPALQGSDVDWCYKTIPQTSCANRVHDWPRGRIVGGSSAINAMAYMRGHPSDFDTWVTLGAEGWGYADLVPYFERAESSRHSESDSIEVDDGPIHLMQPNNPHPLVEAFHRAAAAHGLDRIDNHDVDGMAGATVNTLTIRGGLRQTSADAYLTDTVLARSNLTLMTDTEVRYLNIAGGRCRGVHVRAGTGETMTVKAGETVLCAGAIGSPVLLQQSGIGHGEDLKTAGVTPVLELPGVGQNLHDHLLAGGNVYVARKTVPTSRFQHSESVLYIRLPEGGPAPDIAIACVAAPIVTEQFESPPFGEAFTLMFGVTHPKSRGRLKITSPDGSAMPHLDPSYLSDPYDRDTALEALDWSRKLGHDPAMDEWREREMLPSAQDLASRAAREEFVERAAYTHHHPVGTCRMGTDGMAVVGPDLMVRGIGGLSVADASVLPSITTGPVNAAITAIAEKASDLIGDRN